MKITHTGNFVLGIIDIILGAIGIIKNIVKLQCEMLFISISVLCCGAVLVFSSIKTNKKIKEEKEEKRRIYELMFRK